MKGKRVEPFVISMTQRRYAVSREELASVEILKSTGIPLLEAAQAAYVAVRAVRCRQEGKGEACSTGISGAGMPEILQQVLEAGIKTLQEREQTVPLHTAAWASVESRAGLRPTSRRDLRHFVRRILRVEGVADMPLRSIRVSDCKRILSAAFGNSPSSYKKGRAVLSSIFSFAIKQEWVDCNPALRVVVPPIQEKRILPLSNKEVDRLRAVAQTRKFEDMRFSLGLLLYSGVRPAEVERLSVDDVCWAERLVIIRPQKSKTGGGRVVPLRALPGLRRQDCTVPRNWKKRWLELRLAAGFTTWKADVCRHTFASYHAAYFRNMAELQLEMGHRNLALLRSRYMVPVHHKDAVSFWAGCRRHMKNTNLAS